MTKKEELKLTLETECNRFRIDSEDLESFKKFAIKEAKNTSLWKFGWWWHQVWFKWDEIQENAEREEIENKFQHKGNKYLCIYCGKEKPKEQFFNCYSEYVQGKRAKVLIYNGLGFCQDCYEADRAERKRASEEHKKELRKQWYQDHKEEIAEKQKQNRAARNESNRKYCKTHRERINQHIAERKANDPIYRLKCQARKTIYMSFVRTGNIKQEKCESLTGLSIDAFVEHLLNTYEKNYGIPWDGKESVHIDHIIPLATAKSESDVIDLCKYSNLQLLKAKDNIAKSDKLVYQI